MSKECRICRREFVCNPVTHMMHDRLKALEDKYKREAREWWLHPNAAHAKGYQITEIGSDFDWIDPTKVQQGWIKVREVLDD